MDKSRKNIINYMVAAVIVLALGRFFILQLVVPSVSKMLLTLVSMLVDVKGFGVIMLLYMLIMVQVFSTMYQDTNPQFFEKLYTSFQTSFD